MTKREIKTRKLAQLVSTGMTIKEAAKKVKLTYGTARGYLTKANNGGIITALQRKTAERCEIKREKNIERWKQHAFLTAEDYMEPDEFGFPRYKPFNQWTERAKNAVQEVSIIDLPNGTGRAMKVKFYSSQVALKNLGEMNGDYADVKTGKAAPIEQKTVVVNINPIQVNNGNGNGNGNGLHSRS